MTRLARGRGEPWRRKHISNPIIKDFREGAPRTTDISICDTGVQAIGGFNFRNKVRTAFAKDDSQIFTVVAGYKRPCDSSKYNNGSDFP